MKKYVIFTSLVEFLVYLGCTVTASLKTLL